MTRLFVQYLAICKNGNFAQHYLKNWQNMTQKLAKDFFILLKWQKFAKSDLTGHISIFVLSVILPSKHWIVLSLV